MALQQNHILEVSYINKQASKLGLDSEIKENIVINNAY